MPDSLKISCYQCAQKLDVGELPPFSRITCPVCASPIIVPKPFGNLLLEERLGAGTMAEVFRAMDITLDRDVAVKILRPELARDTDLSRQFVDEARSASAINHPNIVPIYSCGELDEQVFIIMQFMEGGSLAQRLRQGLPAERQTARWFAEVAKALESAHRHGVSHQNVKPANIFLDGDGNIKVGDFGLSAVATRNRPFVENDQVAPWVTLDLSYYASPERISTGRHETASDLYSLGATLYHVLCGAPPFNYASPGDNLRARFNAAPPEPRRLREDLSPEMNELCTKLLSLYPSERPHNYGQVVATLHELASGGQRHTAPERPRVAAETPGDSHRERRRRPAHPEAATKPQQPATRHVIHVSHSATEPPPPPPPPSPLGRTLRWLALIGILLFVTLGIAHYRNIPWYRDQVRPLIERLFKGGAKGARDTVAPRPPTTPPTTPPATAPATPPPGNPPTAPEGQSRPDQPPAPESRFAR